MSEKLPVFTEKPNQATDIIEPPPLEATDAPPPKEVEND